jgi:hypothetical protein
VEVQKGNNEKWEVKQEGNRLIILRNKKEYMKIVYDNEGRVTGMVEQMKRSVCGLTRLQERR